MCQTGNNKNICSVYSFYLHVDHVTLMFLEFGVMSMSGKENHISGKLTFKCLLSCNTRNKDPKAPCSDFLRVISSSAY